MKRILLAAVLAVLASPAFATLQLSANINGSVFNCVDNTACDTNALVGVLELANQTIAGVDVFGSAQVQTVNGTDALNTSSFQIINHNLNPVSVFLAIGGTNFTGPDGLFSVSGSGTFQNAGGSTIDLSWFVDPANAQGADNPLDLPGVMLASFADVAAGLTDSFAFSNNIPFLTGALFSMSLGTTGTLAAWNGVAGTEPTLVGRSQAIVGQAVPEPSTLALAALGLLGFIRRRAT